MNAIRLFLLILLFTLSTNSDAKDPKIVKAAKEGDISRVERLIKRGADLDKKGDVGRTALTTAVRNGNMAISKILIEAGADVDLPGYAGYTPITFAAFRGSAELLDMLVEAGADPDARMVNDETALHVLASGKSSKNPNSLAFVGELIARGSDYNAVNAFGQTPLHKASEANRASVAELLIERGADPNLVDTYGQTALNLARDHESKQIAQLLESHGAVEGERKSLVTRDSNCELDSDASNVDLWVGISLAEFEKATGVRIGLQLLDPNMLAKGETVKHVLPGITVHMDKDQRIVEISCH